MKKTGWITQRITENTRLSLRNITSLSLYNSGESIVHFRNRSIPPKSYFVMEGDGSASDIEDFEILFDGNKGEVLLDYRTIITAC